MSDKNAPAIPTANRITKLLKRLNEKRRAEQAVSERLRAAAKRAWVDGGGDEFQCATLLKQYLAADTEAWEYLLHYERGKRRHDALLDATLRTS